MERNGQMRKRKVLAVTGIRSEFDILRPVLTALQEAGFEVGLVVSGAHLSDWHGNTLALVEQEGFKIVDKIDSLFMTNRETQRIKGIGALVTGLAQTVERESPDFLVVVGDREESIATALVGNYMGVLVAHISGGDPVYGHTDDPVRHAVSKLAHIHFTITEQHQRILEKMGEDSFRIFNVGNPALDRIRQEPSLSLAEISAKLDFDLTDGCYAVLIKHPLAAEKESAYRQMRVTLEALEELGVEKGLKTVGIFPNTDPGSYDILRAIEEFSASKWIKFYKTLERRIFINLVRHALVLVGNSSMGIVEAPFYKLPVVNVGNRQRGRLNSGNVRFVAHDKEAIKAEVVKACFDQEYRDYVQGLKNIYGDGFAGQRIAGVLAGIDPKDKRWLVKKLSYVEGDAQYEA
ncbi:MAG: UDP-N-acetylglucosamine 2-epimerase [Bacillota bacterium]|jgi:GDP/UDP-N,N'-diacetylbacillosamine 2-epimerase (hydrolysing)|nr:UDP-N-acetylglucosamine 2-epimerase [Bacillota bacterium]